MPLAKEVQTKGKIENLPDVAPPTAVEYAKWANRYDGGARGIGMAGMLGGVPVTTTVGMTSSTFNMGQLK